MQTCWYCKVSFFPTLCCVCIGVCVYGFVRARAHKQQNDYCEHSSRCLATESLCFLGNGCRALAVWVIGNLDNGEMEWHLTSRAEWTERERERERDRGRRRDEGKLIIILHCIIAPPPASPKASSIPPAEAQALCAVTHMHGHALAEKQAVPLHIESISSVCRLPRLQQWVLDWKDNSRRPRERSRRVEAGSGMIQYNPNLFLWLHLLKCIRGSCQLWMWFGFIVAFRPPVLI